MKTNKTLYLVIPVILILLFSSCNFFDFFFTREKEDEEIGKFEDINIFDRIFLPNELTFITEYSMTSDENYLYAITTGDRNCPGQVVKVPKNGGKPLIKTLLNEARLAGFADSSPYDLESVDYYNHQLIVKTVPVWLQPEHGEFEIYCMNPENLSVQWRWVQEENGKLDYHVVGCSPIPRWNDYYIIYYAEEKKDDGFYIVFLDLNGNQVVKRFIQKSRPKDEGNICIVDNKLFLHQELEPLIIYDLGKLLDLNYNSNDCIDFSFSGEANIYSNIVTDGKTCYFCNIEIKNQDKHDCVMVLYAVSLSNYQTLWKCEFDDEHFDCINSILLYEGNIFLAADYGCVYCVNSKNGKLNWKTKISDETKWTNLLCEGCIVENYFVIPCASNSFLYYFDINTGKIKGKYNIPVFGGKRHCYVEGEYLYITTGSYIARLKLIEEG